MLGSLRSATPTIGAPVRVAHHHLVCAKSDCARAIRESPLRGCFSPFGLRKIQPCAGNSWLLPQAHTSCVPAPSKRERYKVFDFSASTICSCNFLQTKTDSVTLSVFLLIIFNLLFSGFSRLRSAKEIIRISFLRRKRYAGFRVPYGCRVRRGTPNTAV